MSYDGPGRYRHYKGGFYNAIGVGEHETTGAKLVIYTSESDEHEAKRAARGVDFVLRPLGADDGPDPWNSEVTADGKSVPRFRNVDAR